MVAVSNRRKLTPRKTTNSTTTIHTIKVTLRGSSPPIWRRLEVPSRATLVQVHDVIQRAFGWENEHLWAFDTPDGRYGPPGPTTDWKSASSRRLGAVASRPGAPLRYTYDFGDDWEHDLEVEAIGEAESGVAYPRCLAGRGAGPPEDSGGIWGYQELVEIVNDSQHPDHRERMEWLDIDTPDEFDPRAFDLAQVNAALGSFAAVVRR